jgi:hypothetical protein
VSDFRNGQAKVKKLIDRLALFSNAIYELPSLHLKGAYAKQGLSNFVLRSYEFLPSNFLIFAPL